MHTPSKVLIIFLVALCASTSLWGAGISKEEQDDKDLARLIIVATTTTHPKYLADLNTAPDTDEWFRETIIRNPALLSRTNQTMQNTLLNAVLTLAAVDKKNINAPGLNYIVEFLLSQPNIAEYIDTPNTFKSTPLRQALKTQYADSLVLAFLAAGANPSLVTNLNREEQKRLKIYVNQYETEVAKQLAAGTHLDQNTRSIIHEYLFGPRPQKKQADEGQITDEEIEKLLATPKSKISPNEQPE